MCEFEYIDGAGSIPYMQLMFRQQFAFLCALYDLNYRK